MTWQDKIRDPNCTLCPLHESAQYVCLMGTGKKKARLIIVGEAPGAREDETHQAFVGPAGQLLTQLLEEVGITREDCYITNVVKCRPPGNAQPTRHSAKICGSTYLAEEIRQSRATHALLLGNTALQGVVGRSGITKYRGKIFNLGDIEALATFHPAAALRSPRYLPAIRADFATLARLYEGGAANAGAVSTTTRIINSVQELRELIVLIRGADEVAFDLETTGLEEYRDDSQIVTIGVSWEPGTAAVVPIHHPESKFKDPALVLKALKVVLENHPGLIGHNAKFDARWLGANGIYVPVAFDTMIAAHLLDENQSKGLKSLSQILLGASDYDIGDEVKRAQEVPLRRLADYNGADCDYTLQLKHLFEKELEKEPRIKRLFGQLMMPASQVLTQVEAGGMWVDSQRLADRSREADRIVLKLTEFMDQHLPDHKVTINYNSPQQVAEWLFNDLDLPIIEETNGGAPSTKESVLFQLEKKHVAVKALLKYRKWHKFQTTYLGPWEEQRDRRGRIHTSYRPTGTVTGRLSSASPNLQQVPRDPFIRSILGAPPGWLFMEADFSQIELRLAAMVAKEDRMLRILALGQDVHTSTAVSILRTTPDQITKDLRVIWGKHPNFGLVYGMGPGDNVNRTGYYAYCWDNGIEVTMADAQLAYDRFHETYPKLRQWHDRQKRLAHRYKRVANAFGRVRHLPDIDSSDKKVVAEAERQAINSPIQSLANELMLLAMIRLHDELDHRVARIVGTVHDALLFEVKNGYHIPVAKLVKDTMEDVTFAEKYFGAQITVPIVADVSVGQHWGETEELSL